MPVKRLSTLLVAAWLAGCSCDGGEATPPASAAPETIAPPPRTAPLPTASRTDLPAATPAITITVRDDAFVISNAALVASWPPAERAAVGQTRPLGDADYPVVEREIDDASTDLVIPALHDPMAAVASIESTRASIVHADGTTQVFALRAEPDVHWGRLLSAIYAAGSVGLSQPRLVLASPDGERELRIVLPSAREAAPTAELEAALALARAVIDGTEGAEIPPEPDSGVPLRPSRVAVLWHDDGLVIQHGLQFFAPGCTETASDRHVPAIPTAALTPATLDACLAALDTSHGLIFQAPSSLRYADAVAILETLVAHGEVGLSPAF